VVELVGTWRLASCVRRRSGGRTEHPFGEQPVGLLLYTQDGRMSVHLAFGDREPLSSLDLAELPEAEAALAFRTYLGYGGRYRISGDTVVHEVEVSSIPDWVGTELVRRVSTSGEALVLRTPEELTAEGPVVWELQWLR
jgi:Lipocalin-like domain